jgi:hypothetical protein
MTHQSPPLSMEFRFSPEELETTPVDQDQNSTMTPTRRKMTPKGAAVVGTDRSRCKEFDPTTKLKEPREGKQTMPRTTELHLMTHPSQHLTLR